MIIELHPLQMRSEKIVKNVHHRCYLIKAKFESTNDGKDYVRLLNLVLESWSVEVTMTFFNEKIYIS